MSNGDFEVMPIGTIAEVQAMRKFANELITLTEVQSGYDDEVLANILEKINEIRNFYAWHTNQYPVTV